MPQLIKDPFLPSGAPEEQGMDPRKLERLNGRLHEWKIKHLMVVRGGALVWEWHEKGNDRLGAVYSCTKSFLSALIGIAVGQGTIAGVEQRIADFFPELLADADERKAAITVKHLLTMTPGFDWPDFDKPYYEMVETEDWVRFVLDRPMAHEPGSAFTYNSGSSHLLSAILTRTTGQSALAFARQHLFDRMGFAAARWKSAAGVNDGGTGLQLTARDMAKFGLLYLRKGDWFGRRLIPEAWVDVSTSVHHKGLSNYEPPIFAHYGYHWWVSPKEHNEAFDCYFALGYGGQYIFVVPELDLVVAVRKEKAGRNNAMLSKNLFRHVADAIER